MKAFNENEISRSIIASYGKRLVDAVESDVLVAGGGPAGLVAASELARSGFKVSLVEKRLAPGGGIWGGGMGMNRVVVQPEALGVLDTFGIRYEKAEGDLYQADAVELASGLIFKALQDGVMIFNLLTVEDICIRNEQVTGCVVNRTTIAGVLPVDPIMFSARCVLDGTGHDMNLVEYVRKRKELDQPVVGEGAMDAFAGEQFVVDNVCEIYPGLWVAGMSVCAALGGPRMGPVFGGMLLSGKRASGLIAEKLRTE